VSMKSVKQTIAVVRCIEAVDPDRGGMDEVGVKNFLSEMELQF